MNDMEWLRARGEAMKAQEAEYLRKAKEEASRRGKEPFDFAKLCTLYDPSSEMASSSVLSDPQGTSDALERRYYIDYPNILTIAEFAARLEEDRAYG
jgi:hypothetical protein